MRINESEDEVNKYELFAGKIFLKIVKRFKLQISNEFKPIKKFK